MCCQELHPLCFRPNPNHFPNLTTLLKSHRQCHSFFQENFFDLYIVAALNKQNDGRISCRAKAGLQQKEVANAQKLRELEGQKSQFAGQIEALEANVVQLSRRAEELELQARRAREEASAAAARLKELK